MGLLPNNNHVDNVAKQEHTLKKVHQINKSRCYTAIISISNDESVELSNSIIKAKAEKV